MLVKRLFPSRWARILAWTGAALAWSTVGVASVAKSSQVETLDTPGSPDPLVTTPETSTTLAVLPDEPAGGLVIIRYQPVAPPAPEVVVRSVAGPRVATQNPTPAQGPAPAPVVRSSGS